MNSKFKILKLENVATIFAGGDKPQLFSETKNDEFKVPVYANGETNKGLQGYTNKAKVIDPAVTVSARGTIGYAVLRREPFVPIVRLLTLIPNKDLLDIGFLYYYLTLYRQKGIGSSQKQLIAPDLSERTISLPLLSTQKSIAKVLSYLDAKIELNNRINAELEAMAKIIYDYWFVQFDFPDKNGKPYKSSGGKMVWNEKIKREIPEGWEVAKIGKALKVSLGGTPSTENIEFWDNGTIPWLNSGEIAEFPIVNSELKITPKAILNSATELLPKGTVLLSITRHLRPSILAIDACANQSVVGIKEKAAINSNYIYPLIKNEIPRYMTLRTGAQQPHINKETVEDTDFVIPDNKTLEHYNRIVTPIYNQINLRAFENLKVIEIRDFLLPMLMNGQISVGDTK